MNGLLIVCYKNCKKCLFQIPFSIINLIAQGAEDDIDNQHNLELAILANQVAINPETGEGELLSFN